MKCKGCQDEMQMCYDMQRYGVDAGLEESNGHFYVFALNNKGELILW